MCLYLSICLFIYLFSYFSLSSFSTSVEPSEPFALKSKLRLSHQSCPTAVLHRCGTSPLGDVVSDISSRGRVQQKSPARNRCSCSSERRRGRGGRKSLNTLQRECSYGERTGETPRQRRRGS